MCAKAQTCCDSADLHLSIHLPSKPIKPQPCSKWLLSSADEYFPWRITTGLLTTGHLPAPCDGLCLYRSGDKAWLTLGSRQPGERGGCDSDTFCPQVLNWTWHVAERWWKNQEQVSSHSQPKAEITESSKQEVKRRENTIRHSSLYNGSLFIMQMTRLV